MDCHHCRIGKFQPTKIAYYSPLNEHLMVIPNVPAYQCDVCGVTDYDEIFMLRLHYLIDKLTGKEPNLEMDQWQPRTEPIGQWQPEPDRRSR